MTTKTIDLDAILSSEPYLSTALAFSPPPPMSTEEADRRIDEINAEVWVEELAKRLATGIITAEDYAEAMTAR